MADRMEVIEEQSKKILDRLDQLDQAWAPGRFTGDSLSYFQEERHPTVMKGLNIGGGFGRTRLPEGYKPYSTWKTLGQCLRDGVKSHYTEVGGNSAKILDFTQQYFGCFKTIQGMSTSAGADGGFAILPEFAPGIYERVYANDIFSRTDNFTVGGNRMTFPRNAETSRATGSRSGGIRAYWVGEGGDIEKSAPKLAETELKLKKLAVVIYLTQELIDDNAYALEQWAMKKATDEFNFMTGLSVFRGAGGAQPLGFLNSSAFIPVDAIPGQGAGTIVAQNILDMWSRRLAVGDTSQLAWYINQNCEPQLNKMTMSVGTGGQVVYTPPGGLSSTPYATLMGRPVIPCEFSSACGTVGDITLANLKDYVTISKGGISEAVSMHVEFLTDQLAVRFIMRLDGRPYEDSPITPFQSNGSDTQSSFIGLATR